MENTDLAILIPFLSLIPLVIVGSIFAFVIKSRNKKLDIEMGNNPVYTTHCGGRFGLVNYSSPFVRVAVYDKFIVISYTKTIVLQFDEIENIYLKRFFFVKGLKIEHHKDDIPKNIVLFLWNYEDIMNVLPSRFKYE